MGIVFKNNAKTTLASNLTSSATSASVTDGSVFPSLSAGEFFLITFDDGTNNEICKCTARSGNTLTIVRAQESTTARSFSSGDAAEGRVTAGVLETIQENIAAKSANQTVYNATTASSATDYDIGIDPSVEANAMVFLNGVMQHHDTFSFSGSTLTFDAAPPNGMALEVIVDNLINLQSSNLTVDTFTATSGQTDFVLSDTPAAETNLIVFVDGVFQDQDSYTISNNTLTITDGVVLNRGVTVYVINPVNIGTPSDGTVTSAKLSGNITMPGTLTVGSNDVAFDSPTFVVDNANSRVGLGTASPSVPVDIVGDVKMSANLTVDTSTLVVDSTNNRVGIGTTSPSYALDVYDVGESWIRADSSHTTESTANSGLRFAHGGVNHGVLYHRGSDDALLYFDNIASSTRFLIDSSGNFGINTTSPTKSLSVKAPSGSNGGIDVFHNNGNKVAELVHHGSGDEGRLSLYDGGTGTVQIHGETGQPSYINSGNVGIGESSPDKILHLKSSGATGIVIESTTNAQNLDIDFYNNSGSAQGRIRYAEGAGSFGFAPNVSATDALHILYDGKVGIGTDSPATGLHVVTGGGTTPFRVQGGGNVGVNIMEVGYAGGAAGANFIVDDNGSVGIGTSNPASKLHVESSGNATIRIQAGTSSSASLRLRNDAHDYDVNIQTNDNFAIYSQTASTERLVITPTGSVALHGVATAGKSFEVQDRQSGYSSFWVDDNNRDYGRGITNAYGLLGGNSTQYDGDGATYPLYGFGGAADNHSSESLDFWIKSTTSEWQPMVFFAIAASTNTSQTGQTAGWALIRATHYNNGVSTSVLDSGGGGTFSLSVIGSMDASDYMKVRVAYSGGQNRCNISVWCNTYQHIRGVTR